LDQQHETVATVTTKLSPPAAVLGAHVLGMPVAEWIQWLTVIYLLLLIGHKLYVIVKDVKKSFGPKE
jgi:hypothetical protein